MSMEMNMLQERCLSIFWNLLRPLLAYVEKNLNDKSQKSEESEQVRVKALLCLERILFKFMEKGSAKVKKLCELF